MPSENQWRKAAEAPFDVPTELTGQIGLLREAWRQALTTYVRAESLQLDTLEAQPRTEEHNET
jgi:hypothetical protein